MDDGEGTGETEEDDRLRFKDTLETIGGKYSHFYKYIYLYN